MLDSNKMNIDTGFNFQAALANPKNDADKCSVVLQDYHHFLWSKQLPGGEPFQLEKLNTACRLRYSNPQGDVILSSDRAVATFTRWKRLQRIISQVPRSRLDEFINVTETIGGIIIWPCIKVDGKMSINSERGLNRKICDRLDLTVECIRRYYNSESSPLNDTFKRYDEFFRLFVDFRGYVDFFLFQDFVNDDCNSVNTAQPFDNFESSPVPSTKEEYIAYMDHTTDLVRARNIRIDAYVSANSIT